MPHTLAEIFTHAHLLDFLAQTKGRRERERERKSKGKKKVKEKGKGERERRKGKEKGKGNSEVKLWQKRKNRKCPSWVGVCDFSRFCQSFTSEFPFPFSFPFLLPLSSFLSLPFPSSSFPFPLSLRPFNCAKKKKNHLRIYSITRFQKPRQLGWARIAYLSRHVRSEPGGILAASTVASCGRLKLLAKKEAVRRVRHCKEVGLQEWPLAGRATVPRVLYGVGLCMSLRRRTILFMGARSRRPHHSHVL